jgi:hypothetical protein
MTPTSENGKARGGCGSRGNRRPLGDSIQLLISGDSRRSHSPATTEIEKKRIKSEDATAGASRPILRRPDPIPQIQLHRIPDTSFLPTSLLRRFLAEILLFSKTLPKSKLSGNQAVEADGVWKAAEYGAFPHPLENAARFPQLPQPLATTRLKKTLTKTPLARPGVADSWVTRSC